MLCSKTASDCTGHLTLRNALPTVHGFCHAILLLGNMNYFGLLRLWVLAIFAIPFQPSPGNTFPHEDRQLILLCCESITFGLASLSQTLSHILFTPIFKSRQLDSGWAVAWHSQCMTFCWPAQTLQVLRRIRGVENVSEEFGDIVYAARQSQLIKNPYWNLISKKKYRPQLVISVIFMIFQQFDGINAIIVSFLTHSAPYLFMNYHSCQWSMSFQSHEIIEYHKLQHRLQDFLSMFGLE